MGSNSGSSGVGSLFAVDTPTGMTMPLHPSDVLVCNVLVLV